VIDVFRVGEMVQAFCHQHGWRFCFIGGVALQRWGEPRVTKDVDLTLVVAFGDEERYVEELLQRFSPRIADAKDFAVANRVLLLQSPDGIGIDIALGGLPYEELVVNRATPFEFLPGLSLLTCSAEDLVVLKAFADRDRDWSDVEGVLIRQTTLDWAYIESQLQPLAEAKESLDILDRLSRLRHPRKRP
jgi:Nucleotidyl transferase AbiEii toxin, Type IV TA system